MSGPTSRADLGFQAAHLFCGRSSGSVWRVDSERDGASGTVVASCYYSLYPGPSTAFRRQHLGNLSFFFYTTTCIILFPHLCGCLVRFYPHLSRQHLGKFIFFFLLPPVVLYFFDICVNAFFFYPRLFSVCYILYSFPFAVYTDSLVEG